MIYLNSSKREVKEHLIYFNYVLFRKNYFPNNNSRSNNSSSNSSSSVLLAWVFNTYFSSQAFGWSDTLLHIFAEDCLLTDKWVEIVPTFLSFPFSFLFVTGSCSTDSTHPFFNYTASIKLYFPLFLTFMSLFWKAMVCR